MQRREFLKTIIGSCLLAVVPQNLVWAWSKTDEKIFAEKIDFAYSNGLNKLPINQIIIQIAKSFIASPYTEKTLDTIYPEKLIINLREFDCVTFIENVLALSLCIHQEKNQFADFKHKLAFIRYRLGGQISYSNRLHYFTDWLLEAEKKNILCLINGFDFFQKDLYLLSKSQLAQEKNPSKIQELQKIQMIEKKLSQKSLSGFSCSSLPKATLQDGDIIGFASNIAGLDFNHTAFYYQESFIHASSVNKQIEINKQKLIDYCPKIKRNSGVIIGRVL